MVEKKINVGLILNDYNIQSWEYLMLEKITTSSFAHIVVIIKVDTIANTRKHTSALLDFYIKQERKLIKQKCSYSVRSILPLITGIPVIEIPHDPTQHFEIPSAALQETATYKPDVFISIGISFIAEGFLDIAPHGIWQYYPLPAPSSLQFFKDIHAGNHCNTVALRMFTKAHPEERTIYRSFSAISVMLNKSINWLYWKAASFIYRKLKELHETGAVSYTDDSQNQATANHPKQNLHILKRLFALFKTSILQKEQWILLYSFHQPNEMPLDMHAYKALQPPKDRFWADPCVLDVNGHHYIFFEELIYKKKKAHISVIEIDVNGKVSSPKPVLQKPYHLSYPFVFKDGDAIYMLPETSGNKTIELYTATSFPLQWQFKMNLMENLHAVDATIHYSNNKYWMFVNIRENEGASDWDELFLFYSEELLTQNWKAHPKNPIISDVRKARPAGRIFSSGEKLYRPSQDSSHTYGYAININEIILLTEIDYVEKQIATILPWSRNIKATHTYFDTGTLSVIDVRIKKSFL